MPLSGTIGGEPIHFYDDYLFKNESLPNAIGKFGTEKALNNTLGSLQIRGILNGSLTIPAGKTLKINLQYRSGNDWKTDKTLCSYSQGTVAAGTVLFNEIPVPDSDKRICRLEAITDFDATAVTITCPIELLPR